MFKLQLHFVLLKSSFYHESLNIHLFLTLFSLQKFLCGICGIKFFLISCMGSLQDKKTAFQRQYYFEMAENRYDIVCPVT
jgi:hypothetical protein